MLIFFILQINATDVSVLTIPENNRKKGEFIQIIYKIQKTIYIGTDKICYGYLPYYYK